MGLLSAPPRSSAQSAGQTGPLTGRLVHHLDPRRNWLGLAEAAGVLVSVPLLLFPARWSLVPLVLLPALWLARLLAGRAAAFGSGIAAALAGFLFMTCVSLYPSVDLSLSRPKLFGLILGLYLFVAVQEPARGAAGRAACAAALVLGGLAVALTGVVGVRWPAGKLPWLDTLYAHLPRLIASVQTSFGKAEAGIHPNEMAGVLALLLPVSAALALFGRSRAGRAAAAAAACLMCAVVLLTASRSAIIGLLIAIAVLLALRWRRLLWGLPLAVLGVVAALAWLSPQRIAESLLALDTATGSSALGRLEVWDRAWSMIQDFPFTGIGLNTFPLILNTLYPLFSVGPDAQVPHAHNLFLQTAVDFGLPGALCFVTLLAAAGRGLFHAWPHAAQADRALIAGLGAGLLGHLLYSLTDAVALGAKPGLFLWIMLGLALSFAAPAAPRRPAGRGWQWAHWALFALACGLGAYITLTGLRMFPI